MLSLMMLIELIPLTSFAQQRNDDFFHSEIDNYEDRSLIPIWAATTQNFGESPVGSGLFILTALGAGYAIAKRRRNKGVKGINATIITFVLLIGLTQCKKNIDTVNSISDGKVYITYSTIDSKTNITEAGIVTWTSGDICHVYASETGYLGSLTLSSGAGTNSATFTGSLSAWTDDETLRFYFLGTNTKKSDNTFVIDYSAQDGTLATIASKYHVSCYTEENVPASKTSFSGQMLNQMALAAFDVSGFGSGNVKIYAASGFRNQITISDKGVLSYGVAGVHPTVDYQSGHIVIGTAGAGKYVALLPSDGDITMLFTSQSKTGSDIERTIEANDFIGSSAAVAITASDVVSSYVDLAVATEHVFSVASGTTVQFAKGNLVYDQGRFKMHNTQYGTCFTDGDDVSDNYKVSGTFDLFGWGTAGWNNGNLLYMPYTLSDEDEGVYDWQYGYGYGPVQGSDYIKNLTGDYANSDWGVYQFGMDAASGWRTLTTEEWHYLINAYNEDDKRYVNVGGDNKLPYGKGKVMGVNGMILLPDSWDGSVDNTFEYGMSDWSNVYTEETGVKWSDMEAAGAVFLPAAGSRYGTGVYGVGAYGSYWSSSAYEDSEDYAYSVYFDVLSVTPNLNDDRYGGQGVRLVR